MDVYELYRPVIDNYPLSYQYEGDTDVNKLKCGQAMHIWKSSEKIQSYHGQFFQNTLHGCGRYIWTFEDKEISYDGQLYANNLEGYGCATYSTGEIFEGLFRNNRRFGPGVFTYPYGSQDVGFWSGSCLLRLSCVVKPDSVPRLAKSPLAKVKLLKFKRLVPVCPPESNKAEEILTELGADENLILQADVLYNIYVRNSNCLSFNKSLYDYAFFGSKDCTIEVALSPEEEKELLENQKKSMDFTTVTDSEGKQISNLYDESKECSKQCPFTSLEKQLQDTINQITALERLTQYLNMKREKILRFEDYEDYADWETEVRGEESSTDDNVYDSFIAKYPWFREAVKSLEIMLRGNRVRFSKTDEPCSDDDELKLESKSSDDLPKIEMLKEMIEKSMLFLIKKKENLLDQLEKIRKQEETQTEEQTEEYVNTETYKEGFTQPLTKTIVVEELLTWNNQKYIMDMMVYSFLHRKMECQLSYSISSLFAGDRSKFGVAGQHEEECILFLENCSTGNICDVKNLGRRLINPDVSDCAGNTGMFFAASKDETKIIKVLVGLGAGLDIFNDECLTPLTLCFCRYLALKHKVTNWEKAFLPETIIDQKEMQELNEWHPRTSITDVRTMSTVEKPEVISFTNMIKRSMSFTFLEKSDIQIQQPEEKDCLSLYKFNDFTDLSQKYVLSTVCLKPAPTKKGKGKKGDRKDKGGKGKKKKKNGGNGNVNIDRVSLELDGLTKIAETITVLLSLGANPNFGEVPFPPLILSAFSRTPSLVETLLSYNADPNIRSLDENMTALHVICCLPVSEEHLHIFKILVDHKSDTSLRTNELHWMEEKAILMSSRPLDGKDEGKTAMHILSMRYDYVSDDKMYINQMMLYLIGSGAETELQYLGHTALTLAMLRGNVGLVEDILKTKQANVNQILGENMGVPLTVLILKRYKDLQPQDVCQFILDLLIQYNANPFNIFCEYGNAIEFLIKEYEPPKVESQGKKRGKGKNKKAAKAKKKGGKGSGKGKQKNETNILVDYLVNSSRNVLTRYLQAQTIKYLYFFLSEEYFDEPFLKKMAQFVTIDEAFQILQLQIYNRRIKAKEDTFDVCYDVLDFVNEYGFRPEIPVKKGAKKSSKKSVQLQASTVISVREMTENLSLEEKPYPLDRFATWPPEIDKYKRKYRVCFQCQCSVGKELIVCPECNLVYFCSDQCNKLSDQMKTRHKCKVLFYSSEKARLDELRRLGIPVESLLEQRFRAVKQEIKERKMAEKLAEKLAKEQALIYGKGKLPKDFLEKLNELKKKILEDLRAERMKKESLEDQKRKLKEDDARKEVALKEKKSKEAVVGKKRKKSKTRFDDDSEKGGKRKRGRKGGKRTDEDSDSEERMKVKGGKKKREDKSKASRESGKSRSRDRGPSTARSGVSKEKTESPLDRDHQTTEKVRELAHKDSLKFGMRGKECRFFIRDKGIIYPPRLPKRFQFLLEKLSCYLPDYDLTRLFLPYACFVGEQLYYRFTECPPNMCTTYSDV